MEELEKYSHGVMEGKGAYNQHAKLPAGGAVRALPLLEKAARNVALEGGDQPIVIADYGSSQGKNSQLPMQIAINCLRQRLGPGRSISVVHVDQPSNDFNSLFAILDADPNRYTQNDPRVFPSAIGRSFYESVLPPASVHLGWSSYAAMWLSRVPALIPGHFIPFRSAGAVRTEFERQAAQDWEAFLSLRARELRPGGRLVLVFPGLADDGSTGFEEIMDHANAVLAEMVADKLITPEERARMAIASYPRHKRDVLVPFVHDGHFQNLEMEAFQLFELPDSAWIDYVNDGNKEALATKQALFFRSVFMPSLASALDLVRAGNVAALHVFADRLEAGLKQRLTRQPGPLHSLVQAMALAKPGRASTGRTFKLNRAMPRKRRNGKN